MLNGLQETNFQLPGQTGFYRGKVRDVYEIKNDRLVLIATDRISAFDHILPRPIPAKGAILNTIAARFLEDTRDIVPNWLLSVPSPRTSIGLKAEALPVEIVVRAYLCGHALRQYQAGHRSLCGVPLPEGLMPYDRLPQPIITPTTKAKEGHDEDISKEEILERGLVEEQVYKQVEEYALAVFEKGQRYAGSRGLILADTKYEFGLKDEQVILIDEIHTPDSSRYFYSQNFEQQVEKGESPHQLSKEFVREWLMENGFQGKENQRIPEMTDEVVMRIQARYLELYETLMGEAFAPDHFDLDKDILLRNVTSALQNMDI